AERTAAEWVALGQAALALGADAKKVISGYFQQAQKKDPKAEEPYLAEGFLALEKSDPARAADLFRAGLKNHGETPDLRYGLARAYFNGDREKAGESLKRVIEINPRHEEAQLARAEMMIASERFLDAEGVIQQVLDVDDTSPKAWALRAAIAALANADDKAMQEARANGLKRVAVNAEVDHTIGRVMSRAYRFAEGAAHQRAALAKDPTHLPSRLQLSNDLLRLGDEVEAWELAAAVRNEDGYNVQAHNLGLLEKEMGGYAEKRFDDFTIKMPAREWPIYGERALSLLREARGVLTARYGVELKRPVLVEFFPHQQDFAIRTFGSLGGQGLLGVCFGTVITMNSPGGLAHGRNNWEATLWHEFCHVVTLSATKNRMPRWLSEGISVYEEAQRNPAWGMKMNTTFREMILAEEEGPTPVGQLSSAFTNAESDDDLMFAYFESAQVVGYVIDKYGEAKFKDVLRDLA
ncbi:MAG: tetratricopeptide repeat protein, partial [Verrucomicrobiales bacterium]|nr:tetratricopeptide repeat protein [Verrucomicrobiales bacterium]